MRFAYQNGGRISQNRRKQYEGRVDPDILGYIEELMKPMKSEEDNG